MNRKYPRIPHLPWSPGATSDDRRLPDAASLIDVPLVVTEKMDGSNLCMTNRAIFARSHAMPPRHRSFDMAKSSWATIKSKISAHRSVFGEWCYARHSIQYESLPGYLLLFSVRDDGSGAWRSWQDVRRLAESLSLPTVPELWSGQVSGASSMRKLITGLIQSRSRCGGDMEGVVIRRAGSFKDSEFGISVAKWVRAGHVRSDDHWSVRPIDSNRLVADMGAASLGWAS